LEENNYSAQSLATEEKPPYQFLEQMKNDTVLSALERQHHDVMRYCVTAVFRGDLDIDRLLPSLRYFEKPCRNATTLKRNEITKSHTEKLPRKGWSAITHHYFSNLA
jgi:hypothetical protein